MRGHSEAEPIYMRSKLDMWTLKCHADTLLLHRSRQTSQLQLLCLYTYELTSGVHTPFNHLQRGGGVYLEKTSLVRITWPSNPVWIRHHGRSTTLLESLAALQGLLTAISQFGRKPYIVYCDNAGTCHAFRKGSSKWCAFEATGQGQLSNVNNKSCIY